MADTVIGNIAVRIRARNEQLIAGLKGANKQITSFAGKFKQDFGAIAAVGAAGAVAFGAAIVKITNAASDLEETQSKFNTVFRGSTDAAEAFALELQTGYATSEVQAKRFLATIQDTLVPMGLQREAATQLSGSVVKLAADIGSFNNLPTEQVVRDIQSALVGNTETVRKYGISIKAAAVDQSILDQGLAKSKAEITEAQRVTERLRLITEGSADAVGDMARTSASFANRQKALTAQLENLMATLGQITVGPGADFLKFLSDAIEDLNEGIKVIAETSGSFKEFGITIVQGVVQALADGAMAIIKFIETVTGIGPVAKLLGVDIDAVNMKIDEQIQKLNQNAQVHLQRTQQKIATERLRAQQEKAIKNAEALATAEREKKAALQHVETEAEKQEALAEIQKEADEFTAEMQRNAEKRQQDLERQRSEAFQKHKNLLTSIANESETAITTIFDKNLSEREKKQRVFRQVMGILQRQITNAVIASYARQKAAAITTSTVEAQAQMAPTAAGYFKATAGIPFVGQAIALGFIATAFAFINSLIKFQEGGLVRGVGRRDTVPALLTPGERVLTREENRAFEGGALSGKPVNVNVTISGQFLEADETKWRQVFKRVLGEVQRQTMIQPTSNFFRRRGSPV